MAQKRRRKAPRRQTKAEMAMQYIQYSKKITTYVLAFWGVYRLAQLVAGVLRPELADSLVKLASGIDTMAIFFGGFYTTNSIAEKGFSMHQAVQQSMYASSSDDEEREEYASNG